MRPATVRYPVDRYLVQSNNQNELINTIDDDIWTSEPALRPEDEIMLRKLHEMLQSTADDLKLLSSEISKHHEHGTQVKTAPMPLDEEFNEKIHIEEVVNAKFHGHKIIEQKTVKNDSKRDVIAGIIQKIASKQQAKKFITTGVQVKLNETESMPVNMNTKKLSISNVKTMEINNKIGNDVTKPIAGSKTGKKVHAPVSYNEFSYKYEEPKINTQINKHLQLQDMPRINIRSELRIQNVLQLDIFPEIKNDEENVSGKNNVAVISMQHETSQRANKTAIDTKTRTIIPSAQSRAPTRKTTKMSAGDSSESTSQCIAYSNYKTNLHKQRKKTHDSALLQKNNSQRTISNSKKTREIKHSQKYLEEWKRRLNSVYRPLQTEKREKNKKHNRNIVNLETNNVRNQQRTSLNNGEYIPYSKLTLGGVRVSDIEDEISNISNKNDLVLSPILDKILSRENSFHQDSPRKHYNESPKILTTSDENLLQEILDVQNKVSNILPNSGKSNQAVSDVVIGGNDSYADDFDDAKTDISEQSDEKSSKSSFQDSIRGSQNKTNNSQTSQKNGEDKRNNQNLTKLSNLSFKNSVDIFEFVHSVDTQDNATQSNQTSKISLKETQTSPRNEKSTIQPIHNDLWPSIDPRGDVEKMFKLEKDFIKKLIIDEYGDVIEKSLNKPSTSNSCSVENPERNTILSQKNTQTSPAHVKTVMTSPTRTKTRTTSPFALSIVNQQLSPIILLKNEDEHSYEKDYNDLAISINLSSPRFNLRLPQTSREVLSNINAQLHYESGRNLQTIDEKTEKITMQKQKIPIVSSSSSSIEADYSSDISSIGEINRRFKKMQRMPKVPSLSDLSSSSSVSRSSFEASAKRTPLRSEGEISLSLSNKKKHRNKRGIRKSDGEMSLGQLL